MPSQRMSVEWGRGGGEIGTRRPRLPEESDGTRVDRDLSGAPQHEVPIQPGCWRGFLKKARASALQVSLEDPSHFFPAPVQ